MRNDRKSMEMLVCSSCVNSVIRAYVLSTKSIKRGKQQLRRCKRLNWIDKIRELFPRDSLFPRDQVQNRVGSGKVNGTLYDPVPRSISGHLFIPGSGGEAGLLSNKACLSIYETRQTGRLSLCGEVFV